MLSQEHLLEEAKSNGMPILKRRGIVREYLQVIILNSIYRHNFGKKMFFSGGTALRYFYNMPRFSEDLDFDTPDLDFKEFGEILNSVKKGLSREGFSPSIHSSERANLYSAEAHFKDMMRLYGITDKRGMDLMLKIEVFKPPWRIEPESAALSLYGYNFSCLLLGKGNMFSEKLCALFKRNMARDIYDTLFMLKNRFPLDKGALLANKIEGDPRELILERLSKMNARELKLSAERLRPFLFKEDDIELVLNAPLYAERFLREYK